jgi:hypothetical protein
MLVNLVCCLRGGLGDGWMDDVIWMIGYKDMNGWHNMDE